MRKRAVIVVGTDKGLCGALNSNLLRVAARFDTATTVYITAGRKAAQFVARTRRQLAAEFTYTDAPLFSEARAISRFAHDMFLKGEVDQVDMLFTNFISTLTQQPEVRAVSAGRRNHGRRSRCRDGEPERPLARAARPSFCSSHPRTQVLGALLPHYLNFQVYQVLLEAKASEQSARMVAMKNATDNAQATDQGPDARIQQTAPGQHHEGTAGNRQRRHGPRLSRAADLNQIHHE